MLHQATHSSVAYATSFSRRAAIAVMHERAVGLAIINRLLERSEREICPPRGTRTPGDEPPGAHVDHEGHVHHPPPCGDYVTSATHR